MTANLLWYLGWVDAILFMAALTGLFISINSGNERLANLSIYIMFVSIVAVAIIAS